MTDDASADARPDAADEYGEMLDTLDVAITEAQRKIESGRVYDAENERVRIKWVRALVYAVNVRRQVAEARDLEELTERVERLEAIRDTDGDGVLASGVGGS